MSLYCTTHILDYTTLHYTTLHYTTSQIHYTRLHHKYTRLDYNTIHYNTTQHNTTPHHTTPHNTTPHNTTQHNTTQHNTTQHNAHNSPFGASLKTLLCCSAVIMANKGNTSTLLQLPPIPFALSLVALHGNKSKKRYTQIS